MGNPEGRNEAMEIWLYRGAIVLVAALGLSGCAVSVGLGIGASPDDTHAEFDTTGADKFVPPAGAELVGGGLSFDFTAPSDGTIYLTGQDYLLLSKRISEGSTYTSSGTVMVGNRWYETNASTRLYFQPAQ
jgi:hypothetical protein